MDENEALVELLEDVLGDHGHINDLPQAVHEATGIGRTDVHTWALADRIQTF